MSVPGQHKDAAETEWDTVRSGLRRCEDAISQAIGEGCGECAGCQAYAALSLLEARHADAEQRVRDLEVDPDRPNVIYAGDELEACEARLADTERERDGLERARDDLLREIRDEYVLRGAYVEAEAVVARQRQALQEIARRGDARGNWLTAREALAGGVQTKDGDA